MLTLYTPQYKELWFRKLFMADEETMAYNRAWGGTISFPEKIWEEWYDYWVRYPEGKRFYRYLVEEENKEFVGEAAYHYDAVREIYLADVIVYAKYRGRGYGRQGLHLLCEAAKNNGVEVLYDNMAMDNSAIKMFLDYGFQEDHRTEDIIMLKKQL